MAELLNIFLPLTLLGANIFFFFSINSVFDTILFPMHDSHRKLENEVHDLRMKVRCLEATVYKDKEEKE